MWIKFLTPIGLIALATSAWATDFSISGFGTVGYAISDSPHRYLRFIDDRGSLQADSLLGTQINARFSPQWEASVQAVLGPAQDSDHAWVGTASWAFLAYRPNNDLLFRIGRLRIPFFLSSENSDVGTTYSFMRLPSEVYSMAPANVFSGISVSKTWELENSELGLDGYQGEADGFRRMYNGNQAVFISMHTRSTGIIGTLRQGDSTFRIGSHLTHARPSSSETPPPNSVPPSGSPGFDDQQTIVAPVYTAGADIGLGKGYRLMGELAYRSVQQGAPVNNTRGYYLSLLRQTGPWAPYLLYSETHTEKEQPGQSPSNQAASLGTSTQRTWATGFAYTLSPTQKIKGELALIQPGVDTGSLLDIPAGQQAGKEFKVLSVSYSFVF